MLFDWFTIVAQILNFLILMWLLKRFLYKPVLDAIDAREQRISTLLKETKASQEEAAEQQSTLTQKNAAFETEKTVLFEDVKSKAAAQQKQLLDRAAKDVATQRGQWLQALKNEQHALDQAINQRTRLEVLNVARRALTELSDSELEMQIVKVFMQRLETMTPKEREQFKQTVEGSHNEVIVRSAFDFSDEQKMFLKEAIQRTLGAQTSLKFMIDTDLIGGIELVGNGHKLSWNIAAYLSDLDASIQSLIDSKLRFSGESSHDNT